MNYIKYIISSVLVVLVSLILDFLIFFTVSVLKNTNKDYQSLKDLMVLGTLAYFIPFIAYYLLFDFFVIRKERRFVRRIVFSIAVSMGISVVFILWDLWQGRTLITQEYYLNQYFLFIVFSFLCIIVRELLANFYSLIQKR